jgi:hypothetical protein
MNLFVLVYDRKRRELVDVEPFRPGEYVEANRRLAELELVNSNVEVVLLEANSIEELKLTHGRYFSNLAGPLIEAAS